LIRGIIFSKGRSLVRANIKIGILFLLPTVSALCLSLSLPGLDYSILAWFGLVPFLIALRCVKLLTGAFLGFIFGYFYGFGTFYWLPLTQDVSFLQFIFLIVPTFAIYYIPFGLIYSLIYPANGVWIIIAAPSLWVMIEYVRANFFFLALPWNFLGHSQYQLLHLIQISDMTGMYGITFLIVMFNQMLSHVLELFFKTESNPSNRTDKRSLPKNALVMFIVVSITLGLTYIYGQQKINLPNSNDSLKLALVQANVVPKNRMTKEQQKQHLNSYRQVSLAAAEKSPELIVWPASSLPGRINSTLIRQAVQQIARETEAYLLVGGAGVEKLKPKKEDQISYSNSEFLYAPTGRVEKKYNKIRLVPFDEYLPLQDKITWPKWITSRKFSFTRGEEYTLFEVNGAKFGTPICWENLFSDLVRRFVKAGAHFMINVTNEGYTGRTSAPYQTLAMAVFRAVENRVPFLRAATTGVSCYISPTGEIVERIQDSNGDDLFVSGILVKDVPLHSGEKTFYTKYGDVFAFVCIGVVALCLLFALYTRWQSRMESRISYERG